MERTARGLLKQRTQESLRGATKIRHQLAQIDKADMEIERILLQWSELVRDRLNSLADLADKIG